MSKHRYKVTGTDDLGDQHVFRTDDRERAEGVAKIMREDLEHVEVTEAAAEPVGLWGSAARDSIVSDN